MVVTAAPYIEAVPSSRLGLRWRRCLKQKALQASTRTRAAVPPPMIGANGMPSVNCLADDVDVVLPAPSAALATNLMQSASVMLPGAAVFPAGQPTQASGDWAASAAE